MRLAFSAIAFPRVCLLAIFFFVGCAESPLKVDSVSTAGKLLGQIQAELRDLPGSVPEDLDMGVLHNKILGAFERYHSFSEPITPAAWTRTYVQASNQVFEAAGIDFLVTETLVRSYVELYEHVHRTHGYQTPTKLIQVMEDAGFLSPNESLRFRAQLLGASVGDGTPVSVWASQVQVASTAYWQETGRLGQGGTLHSQGWLKDLFVVASDTAGGIAGGLLGVAVGTAVGGPAGGSVGGVIGGSLGAGAFSGLSIAILACDCEET